MVVDRSRSAETAASTVAKLLDNAYPVRTMWNVGPTHGPQRTVLDDVLTPTDQEVRSMREEV